MKKKILTLGLAMTLAIPTIAATSTWEVDIAHSSIGFKVKHMTITTVFGKFNDFTINLNYDEGDITKSTLNVSVDLASINTDNEKRDNHLRSADFFDVENTPTMTFVSKQVKQTDDGLSVTGDLTIRDVTKEVTVLVEELTGQVKGPRGDTRIGVTASAKINRTDFGLMWNVALEAGGWLVSENVDILINAELIKKNSAEKQ